MIHNGRGESVHDRIFKLGALFSGFSCYDVQVFDQIRVTDGAWLHAWLHWVVIYERKIRAIDTLAGRRK